MMNERKQRFVEAYLGPAKGVAAKAARLAGYACGTTGSASSQGERLLRDVDVRAAIEAGQKATRDESIADRMEQERFLTRVLRGEEADVRIVRSHAGSHPEEDAVPIEPRLRAAEQLAKRHGLLAPEKRELTGKDGGPIVHAAASTADVDAARAALAQIAKDRAELARAPKGTTKR